MKIEPYSPCLYLELRMFCVLWFFFVRYYTT